MGDAELPVQQVGQPRVEVDLDQDRHRQHGDHQGLIQDLLPLEAEQQHQGGQQGGQGDGVEPGQHRVERPVAAPLQQLATPGLGEDHRQHDVEHHREEQRLPGHADGGEPQQQADDRREGEDHDGVVERHLGQGEVGVAVGEAAPHEDHRRAGRGRQQDQAGDVGVELVGGQIGGEDPAHEQPAEQRHREGFHRPVDEQRDADAPPVGRHPMQGAEVDLQQHGDDHEPDQQRHRQVDLGRLDAPHRLEHAGHGMAETDAGEDAERHPQGQVTLEEPQRRPGGALAGDFTLRAHGEAPSVSSRPRRPIRFSSCCRRSRSRESNGRLAKAAIRL